MVEFGPASFYPTRVMFLIRFLIRSYQVCVSPVISLIAGPGAGCRFKPTCSHYFLEACETHGVFRGAWLGMKRLARCHPWGGCGCDPVPLKQPPEKMSVRGDWLHHKS